MCGFYDLGNSYKVLTLDEDSPIFLSAGGYYLDDPTYSPLVTIRETVDYFGVGWLVFKCRKQEMLF